MVLKSLSHAFPYYLHKKQRQFGRGNMGRGSNGLVIIVKPEVLEKKWTSRGMTAPSFSYRKIIYQ